jgi:hypothetical protein
MGFIDPYNGCRFCPKINLNYQRCLYWQRGPRYGLSLALAVTAAVLVSLPLCHGQTLEFDFDSNGNLIAQKSEISTPLQIISQPQPQVVMSGSLASFLVVAADTRGLSYQWRFNGTDIDGATGDALLLKNVSAANEGLYSVVLSRGADSVPSASAALMIDSDGDGLPDSWELAHFGNLNQTTTGDFDGDGVSNLQEFLDGTDPANAASRSFQLTVLQDGSQGFVQAVPPGLRYTNGQPVTLTATPIAPNFFRAWTGDANTTSNTVTLTMTSDKTVTAHLNSLDLLWTNRAGGDWFAATNWSPNIVPGPTDHVVITSQIVVTVNADTECGSLTLGGDLQVLTGTGTLTLHGPSSWTAGNMTGTGRTVIAPGGSLIIGNPNIVSVYDRTLENGGTMTWTGGFLGLGNGIITNRAGALFDIQGAGQINAQGSAGRIDNAGIFRKSMSAGTLLLSANVAFNNYGTADIQIGMLQLGGGGANNGVMTFPGGTALNLSGGTFGSSAGSSITGAGQFTVSGGANLAGLVNLSGTNVFRNGTANLGNYIYTNNTLIITGSGIANFNGPSVVIPTVLQLDGSGGLGGTSDVRVTSMLNWSGAFMSDSGRTVIDTGVTVHLSTPGSTLGLLNGRTLENRGTIIWTGDGYFGTGNAVITNCSGALFEVQNAGVFSYQYGTSRFDNSGTFLKSVNGGTVTITPNILFNNYNTATIQTGTLQLGGGGLLDGTINVPAGTALNLRGGTFTSDAGAAITGAGQFIVSGGGATLSGLVNVSGTNTFSNGTANMNNCICTNNTLVITSSGTANFNGNSVVTPRVVLMDGSTILGGTATVHVTSLMNWTGGNMNDSGRTVIDPGATVYLANPGIVNLNGRTLENGGKIIWTGTYIGTGNAVLTNRAGAIFEVQSDGIINRQYSSSQFDNAGIMRRSVSTGTALIDGGVSFNNYGGVELQSGILRVAGGYTFSPSSSVYSAVAGTVAASGYGQLKIRGTAALNGALAVGFAGNYKPATNDTFVLVTADLITGAFSTFNYPSNQVVMQLNSPGSSVIASVTGLSPATPPPEPALLLPFLSGGNINLGWTAVPNVVYRVEFSEDLEPSHWNPLPGDVTATGNLANKSDALTPNYRFYRVRTVP